jgi:hypothetical protein
LPGTLNIADRARLRRGSLNQSGNEQSLCIGIGFTRIKSVDDAEMVKVNEPLINFVIDAGKREACATSRGDGVNEACSCGCGQQRRQAISYRSSLFEPLLCSEASHPLRERTDDMLTFTLHRKGNTLDC